MNKALRDQVMNLPADEKFELAVELWDSIHPPGSARPGEDVELTKEQIAEAERRLDEHLRDPGSAIPYEEVLTRLRARFK